MLEYAKQEIGGLECIHAAHANANGKPDAIVILAHGFGASGTDLVPLAAELMGDGRSLSNVRFIFPAAPLELDPNYDSRAWWMIDVDKIQRLMLTGEFREMRNESPARLPACREQIIQIIEFAKSDFGVASKRIVVGGFSQGSMLMTDVALHFPERLGGLVVWSGALINETEWKSATENRPKLDIVQSHGRQDPILPFVGGEALRDFLIAANHKVDFVAFNGQHGIPPESIRAAEKLIARVVKSDFSHEI